MTLTFLFSLPGKIFAIPYNAACKLNEIYNETLHKCVNDTEIILESDSTLRRLQLTGGGIQAQELHIYTPSLRRHEPFRNYNYSQDDNLHLLLIIFMGFVAFYSLPKIKKIFR